MTIINSIKKLLGMEKQPPAPAQPVPPPAQPAAPPAQPASSSSENESR